jgi:hypothetical protein
MIKSKNRLIIAGVVILVGGFAINKWLKSMPKSINSDAYAGLDLNMVLSKGSNGSEVAELQRILVNQYNADLGFTGGDKDGIDGDFGSMTEKALFKAKGVKQISLKQLLNNK